MVSVILICSEPLTTVSVFNFDFTPLKKCTDPVSSVKLLFVSIVPPPVRHLPLQIVMDEWSMCSLPT